MISFSKRNELLLKTNALELIPVTRHNHQVVSDGNVNILVPKIKNKKLARLIIPSSISKHFTIELDEIGSAVWLAIDGKNNISTICSLMIERFGARIQPVEERVIKFLSGLYHSKHISFKQMD